MVWSVEVRKGWVISAAVQGWLGSVKDMLVGSGEWGRGVTDWRLLLCARELASFRR